MSPARSPRPPRSPQAQCGPQPAGGKLGRPAAGRLALAACLALGGLLGGNARAENLQQLYDAARVYDATYLAARSLADSAPYRAAQAEALRRPGAELNGSATTTRTDPAAPVGTVGTRSTALSLAGRQPLFNRANDATIGQARKSLEASAYELTSAEQDLIVRVAQAYFDVLAAQDTLTTAGANKAAIAEQLASAKRNFEVGTATITDTREAQSRYDLAVAQELAADNDLRTKRVALDQLVGRNDVAPNPLKLPVVLPAVVPADINTWVNQALGNHPSLRRAQIALEVARLETAKAKAGHLPTLDAVASLSNSRASGDGAVLSGTNGSTRNASLGLQMNLPLFAGYSVENRVKETLALEEKAVNDLDGARRSITQATRQAFLGVQSGLAQVKALEAAESSSLLAVEATQLGYRVGVRVNLDVLNAQTQLFTTRRDLARARYDVLLGSLRLRQAAGQLQPGDIGSVNQLLTP